MTVEPAKEHPYIHHDKKWPNNPMDCRGVLCADCPFTSKLKGKKQK
jgi:hypothetical protein